MVRQNRPDLVPLVLTSWAYDQTVQRAHAMAEKSLKSLEDLLDLFPSALPADLVEALRQFHAEGPEMDSSRDGWERRASPRCAVAGSKLIITEAHTGGPDREVLEVERSLCGFAFLSDRPLGLGTAITVRDAGDDRTEPPGQAEVRSCRQQGDRWMIGCQLLPRDPTPQP